MTTTLDTIRDAIRTIPDFPEPGIQFRDVTTLFNDARAFRAAIDLMLHPWAGTRVDKVVGLEARGFILGGAVAHQLSVGFVPIRKAGKLPGPRIAEAYTLEYGQATMELHEGAIQPGERVLLLDDLIATGGTCEAAITLIRRQQGEIVGAGFIIDLPALGGRRRVEALEVNVHTLCEFDGD